MSSTRTHMYTKNEVLKKGQKQLTINTKSNQDFYEIKTLKLFTFHNPIRVLPPLLRFQTYNFKD